MSWLYLSAWVALVPSHVRADDMPSHFSDVISGAALESASFDDARIGVYWMGLESGGRVDVVGDSGRACGKGQLHVYFWAGYTCAEQLQDGVLAARLWFRALASLRVLCGTTTRALGAMATGKCGGAPELVRRRCILAGGCEGTLGRIAAD